MSQAELLALVQAVDARDGLQQRVLLQPPAQVKHGVARGVETGEQFIHHDDDFQVVAELEGLDDLLVVLGVIAILLHHGIPELAHLVAGVFVYVGVAFALIGAGDEHRGSDHAEVLQEAVVEQRGGLVRRHQLRFEARRVSCQLRF